MQGFFLGMGGNRKHGNFIWASVLPAVVVASVNCVSKKHPRHFWL